MGGNEATDGEAYALAKAVATPAVSTMIADDELSAPELRQFGNLCAFSPIFAGFDEAARSRIVSEIIVDLKRHGAAKAIKAAAEALSPALRETAFCFAARIALADGRLAGEEKTAIEQIAALMAVDDGVVEKILAVIAMLQRGPER